MRSVIYGTLFTVFLASAGTVHAANELDGKSLLCTPFYSNTHPVYGLVFDKGMVSRWQVEGYSKVTAYNRTYRLDGTKIVTWARYNKLYRETLKVNNDHCRISTKIEILQKLDEITAAAKKKNKI